METMNEFYQVLWNGVLLKYHKVGTTEEGLPKWTYKSLLDCNQLEEWKVKEVNFEGWLGYSTFTEEYASNMDGFYSIDNFEEAKAESKRLWDDIVAPNALYRVARYFDNVFEEYVSGALSKTLTHEKKTALDRSKRYLRYYEIIKVTNK